MPTTTKEKPVPSQEDQQPQKKNITRSPSYPMFSLEEAIGKVRVLWEKDGKVGAPAEVVLTHLGYKKPDGPPSGPAARTLAALKKFGLTTEANNRVQLSQLALDIIIYAQTDERHKKALREVALKPTIYKELLERYQEGLPSDDTIRAELVRSGGFNPRQVDGFLRDFRATLDYAGLKAGETSTTGDGVENKRDMETQEEKKQREHIERLLAGAAGMREQHIEALSNSFPIRLTKQNQATVTFARLPIDEEDLERIKKWVDFQGPTLIESGDGN